MVLTISYVDLSVTFVDASLSVKMLINFPVKVMIKWRHSYLVTRILPLSHPHYYPHYLPKEHALFKLWNYTFSQNDVFRRTHNT